MCQHCVDARVVYHGRCQLRAACRALFFALIDPAPEALQAVVVLAWCSDRPVAQTVAYHALQVLRAILFFFLHQQEILDANTGRFVQEVDSSLISAAIYHGVKAGGVLQMCRKQRRTQAAAIRLLQDNDDWMQ